MKKLVSILMKKKGLLLIEDAIQGALDIVAE